MSSGTGSRCSAHCSSIVSASSGELGDVHRPHAVRAQQLGDPQCFPSALVERGHGHEGDVASRRTGQERVVGVGGGDVDDDDALLEEHAGLEPQRVVVPEHVTQPGLLDGLGHHHRAQVVGLLGPLALHERPRRLHQAARAIPRTRACARSGPRTQRRGCGPRHRRAPRAPSRRRGGRRSASPGRGRRRRATPGPPHRGGCSWRWPARGRARRASSPRGRSACSPAPAPPPSPAR